MRAPGFHTGLNFLRVESPDTLPAALAELPGEELTVMQYLDARSADGKFRKYRVMIVDGKLYPLHLAVSRQWKAKRLLRGGAGEAMAAKTLRLHPYWDRDYFATLKRFTAARLGRDLRLCLRTEAALKSQSWLEPRIELERLAADLSG